MACNKCKHKTPTVAVANDSNFKLRDLGIHQISFGAGDYISNINMTDELAVKFLKENPNRISLFEEFPENWKELTESHNPQTEATNSKSK